MDEGGAVATGPFDAIADKLDTIASSVTSDIQPAVIGVAIAVAVVVLGRMAIKKFLKF